MKPTRLCLSAGLVVLLLVCALSTALAEQGEDPGRIFLRFDGADDVVHALERSRLRFEAVLLNAIALEFAGTSEMDEIFASCRDAMGVGPGEERECRLQAARRIFVDHVLEIGAGPVSDGVYELTLEVWNPATNGKVFGTVVEVRADGLETAARNGLAPLARDYVCWRGGEVVCSALGHAGTTGLEARAKACVGGDREACREACELQHSASCGALAKTFLEGEDRDPVRAADLFRRACEGDVASACRSLGFLFDKGIGVVTDERRAAQLYERACDAGDAASCTNLGVMARRGRGIAKDIDRAAELYQSGCDRGDANGCRNLAFLLETGAGLSKDLPRAAALYRRGCDAGHAASCTNLGVMTVNGSGVEAEPGKAAELFRQGCEQGNPLGCTNFGVLLERGLGIGQDPGRALEMYTKGCNGGDALGCGNLGYAFEHGVGGEQDTSKAREAYARACSMGDEHACQRAH